MFNLYSTYFFIYQFLYIQEVLCLPLQNNTRIIYDQRQSGKYNIQISIKDVAIIEMDKNEFIDDTINDPEEYYYDEDDLTVKPISTWMISSTTTKEPVDLKIVRNETEVSELDTPHTRPSALSSSINLSMNTPLPPSSAEVRTSPVHLLMKPVLPDQEAMQEIPQQQIRHDTNSSTKVDPYNFHKVKLPKIITAQSLSFRKKRRHLSFMKNIFDILKLMRIKEV